MSRFVVVMTSLTMSVPDSGSFSVPYPEGTSKATWWGRRSVLIVNRDIVLEEVVGDISVSFGGSGVTVTNRAEAFLPSGADITLQLDLAPLNRTSSARGGTMPAIAELALGG